MKTPPNHRFCSFKRAAAVIAGGVLAASVFSSTASPAWVATAYPTVAVQMEHITQSSLSLPGGNTQVNIRPTDNGVSKMELGNLHISFEVQPTRISPALASVPGLLSSENIEMDVRHAALVAVHQVFAPLTVTDLKTVPREIANRLQKSIQQKLDTGYNGQSPYVITKIVLEDACAIKFGMVSDSCTSAFVSDEATPHAPATLLASGRKKM